MIYEKIESNTRRLELDPDKDFFVTATGAAFPIKVKPLKYMRMIAAIDEKRRKLTESLLQEDATTTEDAAAAKKRRDLLVDNYYDAIEDLIITVSKFNGYKIDKEFIESNMGVDIEFQGNDFIMYLYSLSEGRPIYSADDLKKKMMKRTKGLLYQAGIQIGESLETLLSENTDSQSEKLKKN